MLRIALLLICTRALQGYAEKCGKPGAFYLKFLPVTHAVVVPDSTAEFGGRCFAKLSVELTETETEFVVGIQGEYKQKWYCNEFVILSTGKSGAFVHVKWNTLYSHRWPKSGLSDLEMSYMRKKGVRVLLSCSSMEYWFGSTAMTLSAFFGGFGTDPNVPIFGSKVPDYMFKANLEWAEKMIGHRHELRPEDNVMEIDKNDIKSGTTLGLYRFDGINTLIELGSGSRLGHVAVTLWHGGELYVVESKHSWAWPTQGIQMNKWEDWLIYAHNADNNVVLLPLRDKYQQEFDESKAWEWFRQLNGQPYGFHNFVFGWIDTKDQNTPKLLDWYFVSMVLSHIERYRPEAVRAMFIEAFNLRLGTKAQSMADVWEELYQRDMEPGDLLSMVEKESWEYSDGHNYVCSAFVTSVYKQAGLFGDLAIESTEFTPKDLYELDIFDISGTKIPRGCEGSAYKGYCQIMGKVKLDLGRVGYVKPYAHMNESCPTVGPDYERAKGC